MQAVSALIVTEVRRCRESFQGNKAKLGKSRRSQRRNKELEKDPNPLDSWFCPCHTVSRCRQQSLTETAPSENK
jgi:hypothetical protein